MSRAHPGQSNEYQQKKATRKGREEKLRLLRLAQDVYRHKTGEISMRGTLMNRTKLNKLRDNIQDWMVLHPGQKFDIEKNQDEIEF